MKQTEEKKNSKIYAIIATMVVVLALFVILKPNHNTKTTEVTNAVSTQEEEAKKDNAVARIDITTKLVDADKPQFEVYVNGSDEAMKQEAWMPEVNKQGYVVQEKSHEIDITIKFLNNANTNVIFRGPDRRNDKNEFIPVWVNYTSVTINGENILPGETIVWHNKPYIFEINGEEGEEYEIHAVWKEAEK